MIANVMWFGGGLVSGVVATLVALVVRNKVKTVCKTNRESLDDVITMERVVSRAAEYLRDHPEIDSVAVVNYDRDNVPKEVVAAVKKGIPENVRHILLLAAIRNDESQKVFAVFFAQKMELALQKSLEDNLFVINR